MKPDYSFGRLAVQPRIKDVRAALYVRVSTDCQTIENQRLALRALAEQRGWKIVAEYADQGISGAKGRNDRPGLDKLLKNATQGEFDVVLAWSVDRIGRSLINLLHTLRDLDDANVGIILHQQAMDTTTVAGRAMFQMIGVFSEFERGMIKVRIHAGLDRARRNGVKIGRPFVSSEKERVIRTHLGEGKGILRTAALAGTGCSVVQRIRALMKVDRAQTAQAPDNV